MADGAGMGAGLGLVVFIVIVAVGVVLGITINDHLQAWIDGGSSSASGSTTNQ